METTLYVPPKGETLQSAAANLLAAAAKTGSAEMQFNGTLLVACADDNIGTILRQHDLRREAEHAICD